MNGRMPVVYNVITTYVTTGAVTSISSNLIATYMTFGIHTGVHWEKEEAAYSVLKQALISVLSTKRVGTSKSKIDKF